MAPSAIPFPAARHLRLRMAALLYFGARALLLGGLIGVPLAYWSLGWKGWIPGAVAGLVVMTAFLAAWWVARTVTCVACGQPSLLNTAQPKHPYAVKWMGLSHRAKVAWDVLASSHHHCLYCHTRCRNFRQGPQGQGAAESTLRPAGFSSFSPAVPATEAAPGAGTIFDARLMASESAQAPSGQAPSAQAPSGLAPSGLAGLFKTPASPRSGPAARPSAPLTSHFPPVQPHPAPAMSLPPAPSSPPSFPFQSAVTAPVSEAALPGKPPALPLFPDSPFLQSPAMAPPLPASPFAAAAAPALPLPPALPVAVSPLMPEVVTPLPGMAPVYPPAAPAGSPAAAAAGSPFSPFAAVAVEMPGAAAVPASGSQPFPFFAGSAAAGVADTLPVPAPIAVPAHAALPTPSAPVAAFLSPFKAVGPPVETAPSPFVEISPPGEFPAAAAAPFAPLTSHPSPSIPQEPAFRLPPIPAPASAPAVPAAPVPAASGLPVPQPLPNPWMPVESPFAALAPAPAPAPVPAPVPVPAAEFSGWDTGTPATPSTPGSSPESVQVLPVVPESGDREFTPATAPESAPATGWTPAPESASPPVSSRQPSLEEMLQILHEGRKTMESTFDSLIGQLKAAMAAAGSGAAAAPSARTVAIPDPDSSAPFPPSMLVMPPSAAEPESAVGPRVEAEPGLAAPALEESAGKIEHSTTTPEALAGTIEHPELTIGNEVPGVVQGTEEAGIPATILESATFDTDTGKVTANARDQEQDQNTEAPQAPVPSPSAALPVLPVYPPLHPILRVEKAAAPLPASFPPALPEGLSAADAPATTASGTAPSSRRRPLPVMNPDLLNELGSTLAQAFTPPPLSGGPRPAETPSAPMAPPAQVSAPGFPPPFPAGPHSPAASAAPSPATAPSSAPTPAPGPPGLPVPFTNAAAHAPVFPPPWPVPAPLPPASTASASSFSSTLSQAAAPPAAVAEKPALFPLPPLAVPPGNSFAAIPPAPGPGFAPPAPAQDYDEDDRPKVPAPFSFLQPVPPSPQPWPDEDRSSLPSAETQPMWTRTRGKNSLS